MILITCAWCVLMGFYFTVGCFEDIKDFRSLLILFPSPLSASRSLFLISLKLSTRHPLTGSINVLMGH